MTNIQNVLFDNERIGLDEFCSHPAAELPIPIKDGVNPVYRPQYEIPKSLQPVIDEQIAKWIETKKIELASPLSRWNNSLTLSPKRDLYGQKSDWRTCFDARSINRFLEPDTYGIPRIKELFHRVSGFKYSSSLDLVGAFHQLPVKEEDRYLTCFTWKGVRYQFCGAPFGLTHIPGHFQRLMQTILQDHHQFVLIYLDDIFIFSSTLDEHISHVRAVITTLTNSNMRIRRGKVSFWLPRSDSIGPCYFRKWNSCRSPKGFYFRKS